MPVTKDILTEAMEDVKALERAAMASATTKLVESMAPKVKELFERELGRLIKENNQPAVASGGVEEGKQGDLPMDDTNMKGDELDLESLSSVFGSTISETDEEMPAETYESAEIPTLGEGEGDKEGELDEDVEMSMSTAQLEAYWRSMLQTEAQVSKGFKDIVGGGELDQAAKVTGILDKKSGEQTWEKTEPPNAEDMIPEGKLNVEQVRAQVKQGIAENKFLRSKLQEAVTLLQKTRLKLHESNLFSAKVVHMNKLLEQRITREQREVALESLDKAKSIGEVKSIFEALNGSFRAAQRLQEGRRPVVNGQKRVTSGSPDPKVLRESVDRGQDSQYARLQVLAGLLK
jgi:hypothetical protein